MTDFGVGVSCSRCFGVIGGLPPFENADVYDLCFKFAAADAIQISELLSKTIADAHARTCFYTLDQIHDGMYRTATMATANKNTADKLHFYKTMVRIQSVWSPSIFSRRVDSNHSNASKRSHRSLMTCCEICFLQYLV